jgi:hypothetical protein
MGMPGKPELEHVVSKIAEQALERAAGDHDSLRRLAFDWFPGHDFLDRREIARQLAIGLSTMAARIEARRIRLEQQGKTRCPGGKSV